MSVIAITKPSNSHELKTLSFSDPYKLMTALEAYVNEQASNNTYDFTANKALLKLYQCYPDLLSTEVATKVLCLSMMRLPSTDYLVLSYLVSGQALATEPSLVTLHNASDLLETGKFNAFWSLRGDNNAIFDATNFDHAIREYIVKNVSSTFKNIEVDVLCGMLGMRSGDLSSFQANSSCKFNISGDVVVFSSGDQQVGKTSQFEGMLRIDEVMRLMDVLPKA
mmetsp:Transcript_2583/g.4703  ORF Transcript_2583/g.4703 Transcript_2583/m.4703 type:complete len:223 (+) Transcript_2583:37-705(+)